MARKRKEIVFKVTNIFPEKGKGLTWDELGESILPIIEAALEDYKKLELEQAKIAAEAIKSEQTKEGLS